MHLQIKIITLFLPRSPIYYRPIRSKFKLACLNLSFPHAYACLLKLLSCLFNNLRTCEMADLLSLSVKLFSSGRLKTPFSMS